jgi:uncharacterized membrane protein YdjX (TVP38/TMEM64 family)
MIGALTCYASCAYGPDPARSSELDTGMNRKIAALLLVAAIIAVVAFHAPAIRGWLLAAARWAETSPELAWPVYVIIFTLAIVLMMPGWIFMVAAGYLFGMVTGGVLAFAANLAGSVLAFYVARTFAREWVKEKIDHSPRFSGFDAAVSRRGLYTVMFARLALLPNNLINYACGVTGMGLRDFIIGTAIGVVPILAVNVLVGASTMDLVTALETGGPERKRSPFLVVGAIVLVIALVLGLARRYGSRLASPDTD